ncbi:MAG: zf-HC2 domain-containing protein [Microthrixaceae bacterium]
MTDRPAACVEWQEDLAAWLVTQIDPSRESLLDAHMAGCGRCRDEATSLLAVAAAALGTDLEHAPRVVEPSLDVPPADLGVRIGAAIATERRRGRALRVAAAALVVAASAVVVVVRQRDPSPGPLKGEQVAFSVTPPGATATAVVAPDAGGSVVQLVADGLDPSVTYALWLTPPEGTWDDRVPAGTFRPDVGGHVDVRLRCAIAPGEYGRVWATTPDGQIALDTE